MNNFPHRWLLISTLVFISGSLTAPAESPKKEELVQWGKESYELIETHFLIKERGLYSDKLAIDLPAPEKKTSSEESSPTPQATTTEEAPTTATTEDKPKPEDSKKSQKPKKQEPAFMWGCGVQLSALNAAAKIDPETYLPRAKSYAKAIQCYWNTAGAVPGFDVLPAPKNPTGSDRYYDDNAWIVLDMVDLYNLTKEQTWLDCAEATLKYVLSGEDEQLGGGLFWREEKKESKHTCSNAPGIVSALRVYQLTQKEEYLDAAKRLYKWTCDHLQDQDGLFWDNIHLDGKVDRVKLTYNSALMIHANLALYDITNDGKYLSEAKRIGRKSVDHWCKPDGRIGDAGRFSHLLLGALVNLAQHDSDSLWKDTVKKSVSYLHSKQRDNAGFYPGDWGKERVGRVEKTELIDQASVARAYWEAAELPD